MKSLIRNTTFPHQENFDGLSLILLRFLTFSVFFGRAWQHWFWDIPIRSVAWDEEWMQSIVETILGMSWEAYVLSPTVNNWLENFTVSLGFFYGGLAILSLILQQHHSKWLKRLLWLGVFLLVSLAALYWKEKFMSVGQFIEYALQCSTPLFLYYALDTTHSNTPTYRFGIRIAIALTFIGHGLYALGYYPVPGSYVQMTLDVLGLSESLTYDFLKVAGVLDLLVAVFLFIPRLVRPTLIYCIVWGTLTALARIVANFDMEIPIESWHQWGHTTVYRLPHGGIPLLLWLLLRIEPSSGDKR